MSNDTEVIRQSMEAVAEADVDISPAVYEAFSASMPESDQHLAILDERMKGRMLDQVLLLLMESGEEELEGYLRFETKAHAAYGVEQPMYEALMNSVCGVIQEGLGDGYDSDTAAAFDERIQFLLNRIAAAAA